METKLPSFKKVLVATDLSEDGDAAIATGRAWASRLGASLVIAHVMPDASKSDMLFPQDHVGEANTAVSMRRAVERALEPRVREGEQLAIVEGPAGATLMDTARELAADLIVLGGREPSGKRAFGSVAEYVLTHTRVPVLIARTHAHSSVVIAAVDVDDPEHPAVDHALALGEPPVSAEVIVTYAVPDNETLDADASLVLKQIRRRFPRASGDVRIEHGEPASAVVALAERSNAELIVVGTHARKGLARFVVGSVASAVARKASCSVLVVPLPK